LAGAGWEAAAGEALGPCSNTWKEGERREQTKDGESAATERTLIQSTPRLVKTLHFARNSRTGVTVRNQSGGDDESANPHCFSVPPLALCLSPVDFFEEWRATEGSIVRKEGRGRRRREEGEWDSVRGEGVGLGERQQQSENGCRAPSFSLSINADSVLTWGSDMNSIITVMLSIITIEGIQSK